MVFYLVRLIQLIHFYLILFLVSSIFYNNYKVKKNALTILLFLLFHYITKNGRCGLTELEYLIKGENYQEGFLYRLINPIINVPETYFEDYLFIIHILWIGILSYQIKFYL